MIDSGKVREWFREWFSNLDIAVGGSILLVVLIVGIFTPYLAPYNYTEPDYTNLIAPPSAKHLMGTDKLGRDVFSRIIYGTRTALVSAFSAAGLAGVIGIILGITAGYFGGWYDRLIQALIDISYSFPTILLAFALVIILEPGMQSIVIAIVLGWWPYYARFIRGEVLSTKEKDFVEAAVATGASNIHILRKEITPNVISLSIVLLSITMGQVILTVTLLSFLGLGIQPPRASWGMMLSGGRSYITSAPWLSMFPGVAIAITVLGFNLLGDGLRDKLDPYLRA